MKNNDLTLSGITDNLSGVWKVLRGYKAFIFFLVVASLYGYIIWRINVYSNTPPSQAVESAGLTAQAHIDPSVVQKLESLQNNSVSVQALFNQARQNPFQE
jgi:hypothetical protein